MNADIHGPCASIASDPTRNGFCGVSNRLDAAAVKAAPEFRNLKLPDSLAISPNPVIRRHHLRRIDLHSRARWIGDRRPKPETHFGFVAVPGSSGISPALASLLLSFLSHV